MLRKFYNDLTHDPPILDNIIKFESYDFISTLTVDLISKPNLTQEDLENMDLIIRISNILYNRFSLEKLPLDDGIYDRLITRYKKINPNYEVGSYQTSQIIEINDSGNNIVDKKQMCGYLPQSFFNTSLFSDDILNVNDLGMKKPMCYIISDPLPKRIISEEHIYPELVGTLDKCKYVLNEDARNAGVFDDPSVDVFERDFYGPICNKYNLLNKQFTIICELKFDGVSIEAIIENGMIVKALSRGDTANNIATDYTPIFYGRTYNTTFTGGIKFEAVISHRNLQTLNEIRGKTYKNGRNAIIGLLSASNARDYAEFITLVPLACTFDNAVDRPTELAFLNMIVNNGIPNIPSVIHGGYVDALFQIKKYVEEVQYIRDQGMLPCMVDGVVVSFYDRNIIVGEGRQNFVNKWQMAIKFIPKKARTIFKGYTYSIGKSGEVIPMAHFEACEFIGGIHTKQTIHSYGRFKELALKKGMEIDIEYRNDVITYITVPDTQYNNALVGELEQFPTTCPYCGSHLIFSDKAAYCPNEDCPERLVYRITEMVDKLGFRDFSEERMRALGFTSFEDIFNIDYEYVCEVIGYGLGENFNIMRNQILDTPIEDYKVMSAFGIPNMGDVRWQTILQHYTVEELLEMSKIDTYIKGISDKILSVMFKYLAKYKEDIQYAFKILKIIPSKNTLSNYKKVCFSGFRSDSLQESLKSVGYMVSDSLTKDCFALLAADKSANTSKINKANKYNIPIYTINEFISKYKLDITY